MSITSRKTPLSGATRFGSNRASIPSINSSASASTPVSASTIINGQHGIATSGTDFVMYTNPAFTLAGPLGTRTTLTLNIPTGWEACRIQIYTNTFGPSNEGGNSSLGFELFGSANLVGSMIAFPNYQNSVNLYAPYYKCYSYNFTAGTYNNLSWKDIIGKSYTALQTLTGNDGFMTPVYSLSSTIYGLTGLATTAVIENCYIDTTNNQVNIVFRALGTGSITLAEGTQSLFVLSKVPT